MATCHEGAFRQLWKKLGVEFHQQCVHNCQQCRHTLSCYHITRSPASFRSLHLAGDLGAEVVFRMNESSIYFSPHWFWYRSRSWPLTYPFPLRSYFAFIVCLLRHTALRTCFHIEAVCSLLNRLNDDSGILSWLVVLKRTLLCCSSRRITIESQGCLDELASDGKTAPKAALTRSSTFRI